MGRRKFECEDETGCVAVPKEFLTDFRLSENPAGLSIKPVEEIEGRTIYVRNDVALSGFIDGSASAAVEDMLRRKYWDGETGLSLHVAALRQAIGENDLASETHYEDDGDFIFLQYEITITQDLEIQETICCVEATIESIERRADSLVSRKRDGLPDIFDRGSFESDLTFALNGKQPVALIKADIDHFKQVNDRFGHVVGDEVLRAVANIIASYCNSRSRVPYRYGGEELAIVLTGKDAAKAAEIAESIRADVEQLHLSTKSELKLTISLGVADSAQAGRDSGELVKCADAALYRAKNEGRNLVRLSR